MSETVKHTPGPWSAAADPFHFDCVTDVRDGEGALLATMCGSKRTAFEMEANARLIAAAPELLAALVDIEACATEASVPNKASRILSASIHRARAAIAKATGGQ